MAKKIEMSFDMVAISIEDLFELSSYTDVVFLINMRGSARNSEMEWWTDYIRCEYSTSMATLRLFIDNNEDRRVDLIVELSDWECQINKWEFDYGASTLTVSVRISDYKKYTPSFK